jgi:hypothetical protein
MDSIAIPAEQVEARCKVAVNNCFLQRYLYVPVHTLPARRCINASFPINTPLQVSRVFKLMLL